jgi:hypothetical protein
LNPAAAWKIQNENGIFGVMVEDLDRPIIGDQSLVDLRGITITAPTNSITPVFSLFNQI